jgi:hypothetical protein
VQLRDVVRRKVALSTRGVHCQPERPGAADIAQAALDDLAVAQKHDRLPGVDLGLRVAWQRTHNEFDGRHLAGRDLADLAIDAKREAAGVQIDQLAAWSLAVAQGESRDLLCIDG